MVDIFVIHSGKDYEFVKNELEPYIYGENDRNECTHYRNSNILTLESGEESQWKSDAKRKIKMAQAVIIVVGEDANAPSKKDTMGWEVRQAVKYNKLMMIYNRDNYDIPFYLIAADRFSKQRKVVANEMGLDEIKDRIDNYAEGYYDIFSEAYDSKYQENGEGLNKDLIEQYKLYSKTSEDLVARRQSVNSFYIMVNSALATVAGLVIGIVDFPANVIVVMLMCVAGIILDVSWMGILSSYGRLNAAKMKMLKLMEQQLPVALYDVEWKIMSDKLNNKKYVSFTNSEKRIPIAFSIAYIGILAVSVIFLIVKTVISANM